MMPPYPFIRKSKTRKQLAYHEIEWFEEFFSIIFYYKYKELFSIIILNTLQYIRETLHDMHATSIVENKRRDII